MGEMFLVSYLGCIWAQVNSCDHQRQFSRSAIDYLSTYKVFTALTRQFFENQ